MESKWKQGEREANGRWGHVGLFITREPVILAVLSAVAVALFLGVAGLSHLYHNQQRSLGDRWFRRGLADLNARNFGLAVTNFRAALLYARDDYSYQLNLAEALLGLNRTAEAHAYLVNLWEREPENGLVNLELARIAVQVGETQKALRYYHNAIYATWPDEQEIQRRDARLELIDFLLRTNAKAQAQSELIALAANLGDESPLRKRVGDLFWQAEDYEHALAEYRQSLKTDRRNPQALAGAGLAAFRLGRYSLAQRYLQNAISIDPTDSESASRLNTAELVLRMDPFRRQIGAAARNRVVIESFAIAHRRLISCSPQGESSDAVATKQELLDAWNRMKPRITTSGLRRDPDLAEGAMDLVFRIERETSGMCGTPTGEDAALLLLSKLHEGN